MDLSILTVNWNTSDLLRRCLTSIYHTVRDLQFEVIVVDNGSTDDSIAMIERNFPQVRLIRNPNNRGFASANNQAILASNGRHVLLLNSDAMLLDDSVQQMVKFLDQNPETGAVGGKLLNLDGSFQFSFADFPSLLSEILLLTGLSRLVYPPSYPSYPEVRSQEQRVVDWVSGAFLAVRRDTINDVGLLDEDYFMYTEEVDWCFRMRQRGWRIVYMPTVRAAHASGASAHQVLRHKRAQLYYSKWLFFAKHHGRHQAAVFYLLVHLISRLKLIAWLTVSQATSSILRERARQNVASYRTLLSSFWL